MRARRALRASLAAALVAVLGGACGIIPGGSSASSGDARSGGGSGTTEITVGTMPIIDTAPLQIAQQRGYFEDVGLTVKTSTIQGGADGIPKLADGSLDITFGNYVSVFDTHAKGPKMHIAAEAYNAEEGVLVVTAMPNSGIREPDDLEGRTLAVNTLKNVGTLTVKSVLRTHGVDPSTVQFREMPFPDMPGALKNGSVDAAWMVEPFISQVETELGAHKVFDSASGATAGFPIAGYVTTQKFYEKNTKTVDAFKTAIQRAQKAAQDRATVEKVLPTYTEIDPQTAAIVRVGEYPTTLEPTRLQRVPDLMREFGALNQKLEARQLVS